MSYALEVEMIRLAHEKDLLTTPYVFDPSQAATMANAGADIVVAHMGLTTGGMIGAETALTLEACAGRIDAIAEAALDVRSDIIVLCHGGPIAEPADATLVLSKTRHCHGFYGASSMERLPAEKAITKQTQDFKRMIF
jgi:predicted TIM-barrel enzyme